MNPCELNTMVAATANYLFAHLSEQEFKRLTVFLTDLSKSMYSMSAYRDICMKDRGAGPTSYRGKT